MRLNLLFIFLVLCSVISTQVISLDESNFDTIIDGSKPAFIEFFAPWCGHCKKLAPEYDVVGNSLSRVKDKVVVAKVDCTEPNARSLCVKYEVGGYPTLKWFPTKDLSELYTGARTADAIIDFINTQTGLDAYAGDGPSRVVELTDENFESIVLQKTKDVFVEFYAPWCEHCKQFEPMYDKIADIYYPDDDIVIAKINGHNNQKYLRKYYVDGFPTLVLVSKNNDRFHFEEERSIENVVSFINSKTGSFRKPNGHLNETAGLVPELDVLAAQFVASENKEEAAIAGINAAKSLNTTHAKIYGRTFSEARRNAAYAPSEVERLQKMISSRFIHRKKLDEFVVKLNILSQFVEKKDSEIEEIVDSDSCTSTCVSNNEDNNVADSQTQSS